MRLYRVWVPVAAAAVGAAVAVVGVLAARWWGTRDAGVSGGFGWYAYSQSRRYVDYLPTSTSRTDWARLLVPAAAAGAVLGLLLAGAGMWAYRRFGSSRSSRP